MNASEATTPAEIIEALGITIDCLFIPPMHRQPDDWASTNEYLQWSVAILRDEKPVYVTKYSAGSGHAPASKLPAENIGRHTTRAEIVRKECATGKTRGIGKTIRPEIADVLSCLISDASAAAASFEDFCAEMDSDPDSLKARETYEACAKTRRALLRAFSNAEWSSLVLAFQDY